MSQIQKAMRSQSVRLCAVFFYCWLEAVLASYYSADHKFLQNSFGFLLAYLTMSSLNLTVL